MGEVTTQERTGEPIERIARINNEELAIYQQAYQQGWQQHHMVAGEFTAADDVGYRIGDPLRHIYLSGWRDGQLKRWHLQQ